MGVEFVAAASAGEDLADFGGFDHFDCFVAGERCDAFGDIVEDFGVNAAGTEQDDRAKLGVAFHTDKGFDAFDLFLHHNGGILNGVFLDHFGHVLEIVKDFGFGLKVGLDCVEFGLVEEFGRDDFDDDGCADFGEKLCGFGGAADSLEFSSVDTCL